MSDFGKFESRRRQCERRHAADGITWCVVRFPDGRYESRTRDKAERILRKHPDHEIVAIVPDAMEVGA